MEGSAHLFFSVDCQAEHTGSSDVSYRGSPGTICSSTLFGFQPVCHQVDLISSFRNNKLIVRVYGGHENAIEVLDIANPGHNTSERLKTSFSRKEKGGQKGESALRVSPILRRWFRANNDPFRHHILLGFLSRLLWNVRCRIL